MLELEMNYKGMYDNIACTGCYKQDETTEHFLQCNKYQELTQHNTKTTKFQEDVKSTKWLIRMAENIQVLQEVRTHRLRYK